MDDVVRPRPRPENLKSELELSDPELQYSLAEVEARSDFDPAMSWNPIARLGFKGFSTDKTGKNYRKGDLGLYAVPAMKKESMRRNAVQMGVSPKKADTMEPGDIFVETDIADRQVWSHEMTHRGFQRIIDNINKHPEGVGQGVKEFKEKYGRGAFNLLIGKSSFVDHEELTEMFDDISGSIEKGEDPTKYLDAGNPEAKENLLRRIKDFQRAAKKKPEKRWAYEKEKYKGFLNLMQAAQDILTEEGEPPKSPDYEVSTYDWARSKLGFERGGMVDPTQDQMRRMLSRMEERDAATPENRERDIEMLKETASDVAETFTPYGDYLTGKEAVEDFKRGDYGSAALGATATAVGLIPGVGDVAAQALKKVKKNIMPINQASLEKRGFSYKPGGEYVDPATKEILTNKNVGSLNVKIIPDMEIKGGRPQASMVGSDFDVPSIGSTAKKASTIRVNLVKPTTKGNKSGWSWESLEEGNENLEGINTLISVVDGKTNQHYYTLETDFSKGANLTTYPGGKSEPRLKPTVRGELEFFNKVGVIKKNYRGDIYYHPVYEKIRTYSEGGAVMPMKEQMSMFENGGLMDQGGTVDPVSGNDVPTGSMQKEVRDDIPAQISVGEYVIPADVVRFYGIKFFEELRMGAKEGMQLLKAKGQVGNGDEQVVPDDVPFEMADLVLGNDDEEGMEFNPGGFVNPYGVYQQKQVPVVTVPSAFQAQAAPQVTSQQQYDAKPVFPAQAVQPQVGQRRPVFSVQDLFPKTQKETTKEEDPVEETKVETAQVLDRELGDGGQSSADKAESDQFDRDLALSSIEAGIDGLSVKDGKFSFDSALDLGPLGTIAGFLPGPIGTGIGLAGAIGKGNASSGLTAIGQTLSEMGFNTTGINSVGSSVSGIAGLVQSGVNSDFSKEVEKGLAEYAKANNITIDQAFAQVSKTARARAIALAGDPTGGLGGGYSSDPTGTGVSGYVDPATGAVSAFGPAGSFKDLAMTNPQEAVNVAKNQDIFSKAIFDLEEADVTGTGVTAGQVAAEEAMGLDPFGGTGDPDPEQGNEPGNVDTEGGVAEGIYNKGGFISKRKMRRQKAKDKRKGLATRK